MEQDFRAINHLWRLVDPLSVEDAAALIAGFDPKTIRYNGNGDAWFESENGQSESEGIRWVETASTALRNAILADSLEANLQRYSSFMVPSNGEQPIDWGKSTVTVQNVRIWLQSKGVNKGFFFPEPIKTADFLDRNHPRYAPKLAAVVRAWEEYKDVPGRTPKQTLSKWLNEHAGEFDLTDDDGMPRAKLIEELSAIPNWQTNGGAPKTPVG